MNPWVCLTVYLPKVLHICMQVCMTHVYININPTGVLTHKSELLQSFLQIFNRPAKLNQTFKDISGGQCYRWLRTGVWRFLRGVECIMGPTTFNQNESKVYKTKTHQSTCGEGREERIRDWGVDESPANLSILATGSCYWIAPTNLAVTD